MQKMFKNPFEFTGRIRRAEYALSMIVYIVSYSAFYYAFYYLTVHTKESAEIYVGMLFILFWIPSFWFLIAQTTKRCHDTGKSGWYQLIPFYVFILFFDDSEYGINKYGLNPKNKGNFQEVGNIGKSTE